MDNTENHMEPEVEQDYNDPVAKNPLDSLPKSTMKLDECKRLYNDHKADGSNNFFTQKLESMFDHAGYSMYLSHYKYNDEFTGRPDFVNRNTISGFVQMLKNSTKYMFGSLVLENGQLNGYWIIRGSEPIIDVFGDFFEYNDWEKVDMTPELLTQYDTKFYDTSLTRCIVL